MVQSMTNVPTTDSQAALTQIDELVQAGAELVRVAIPNAGALKGFAAICQQAPVPIIADIHFDYRLALEAIKAGASKLRINPGNIGSMKKVDAVIDAACEANIPIRIGVNAGSLEKSVDANTKLSLPEKLVASSLAFVDHFEARNMTNIVLSAKAHDVMTTVQTYRMLSREVPHIPLHLGITEAGTKEQGTVKSAVGLGMLLAEGIGDTMRVSLTAPPVEEPPVAWDILASLGLRRRNPELVSCPTCGRCQVDMVPIAQEVSHRLRSVPYPISVAVMGCAVNGPGEAKDADIGVACGKGQAMLFAHGKPIKRIAESDIIEELFSQIEQRYGTSPSGEVLGKE